jgi:hypothetical protein
MAKGCVNEIINELKIVIAMVHRLASRENSEGVAPVLKH